MQALQWAAEPPGQTGHFHQHPSGWVRQTGCPCTSPFPALLSSPVPCGLYFRSTPTSPTLQFFLPTALSDSLFHFSCSSPAAGHQPEMTNSSAAPLLHPALLLAPGPPLGPADFTPTAADTELSMFQHRSHVCSRQLTASRFTPGWVVPGFAFLKTGRNARRAAEFAGCGQRETRHCGSAREGDSGLTAFLHLSGQLLAFTVEFFAKIETEVSREAQRSGSPTHGLMVWTLVAETKPRTGNKAPPRRAHVRFYC